MVSSITKALLQVMWFVLIQGPLKILSYISSVLNFITTNLLNQILNTNSNNIKNTFLIICFTSICITGVLFIINFITITLITDEQIKVKIIKSLKNSLFAIFIIIFIPQIFSTLLFFMNFSIHIANNIFGLKTDNLASILYFIGDDQIDWSVAHNISSYKCPNNINDYNIFIQIICTLVCTWTLICVLFSLCGSIIEIIILYILSPIICVLSVVDNKSRLKQWKNILLSNIFQGAMLITTINLFCTILNSMLTIKINDNIIVKQLLLFSFIIAGNISILKSQKILAILTNSYDYLNSKNYSISSLNIIKTFGLRTSFGFSKLKSLIGFKNGFGSIENIDGKLTSTFRPSGILKFPSSTINGSSKIVNGLSKIGKSFNRNSIENYSIKNSIKKIILSPSLGFKKIFTPNTTNNIVENKEKEIEKIKTTILQKLTWINEIKNKNVINNTDFKKISKHKKEIEKLNFILKKTITPQNDSHENRFDNGVNN